jgi:hypothetical protein
LNATNNAKATPAPAPTAQQDHATPADGAEAALQDHFARAHALLVDLGPANTLRVLGGIAGGIATKARTDAPSIDNSAAREWSEWARRMELLATGEGPVTSAEPPTSEAHRTGASEETTNTGEEDEIDNENTENHEDDEDEAAPRPRKDRSRMRRLVAGMFDVSGQVETCRLREVNIMLRIALALGVYADLRSGEIRALEVGDVDLEGSLIRVVRTLSDDDEDAQGEKERMVPIVPQLAEILAPAIGNRSAHARIVVTSRGTTPRR